MVSLGRAWRCPGRCWPRARLHAGGVLRACVCSRVAVPATALLCRRLRRRHLMGHVRGHLWRHGLPEALLVALDELLHGVAVRPRPRLVQARQKWLERLPAALGCCDCGLGTQGRSGRGGDSEAWQVGKEQASDAHTYWALVGPAAAAAHQRRGRNACPPPLLGNPSQPLQNLACTARLAGSSSAF